MIKAKRLWIDPTKDLSYYPTTDRTQANLIWGIDQEQWININKFEVGEVIVAGKTNKLYKVFTANPLSIKPYTPGAE